MKKQILAVFTMLALAIPAAYAQDKLEQSMQKTKIKIEAQKKESDALAKRIETSFKNVEQDYQKCKEEFAAGFLTRKYPKLSVKDAKVIYSHTGEIIETLPNCDFMPKLCNWKADNVDKEWCRVFAYAVFKGADEYTILLSNGTALRQDNQKGGAKRVKYYNEKKDGKPHLYKLGKCLTHTSYMTKDGPIFDDYIDATADTRPLINVEKESGCYKKAAQQYAIYRNMYLKTPLKKMVEENYPPQMPRKVKQQERFNF